MEGFSRHVAHTLDNIGYNAEIVRFRRSCWHETENLTNTATFYRHDNCKCCVLIAGSKAEGITSFFESDIDIMHLNKNAICSENVELLMRQPMTVFELDTLNTPPGYTRLKLCTRRAFGRFENDLRITKSLYHTPSGDIYASSSRFIKSCVKHNQTFSNGNQGPANELQVLCSKCDIFNALCGISPNDLHSFKSRPRQSDWPPVNILTDESSVICQLVPVGMKGSCDRWLEWRFCFIETELKLTHSFNDTQLKMYIILKLVAKDILAVITTEISSYIMKNIVYWISEFYGEIAFREENLVQLVLLGLRLLLLSVKGNNLPYYMIPARNLLAERTERQTRRQLSALLSQILKEGPRFCLRINKLRSGLTVMYTSPATLAEYRNTRDQREVLFFILICLRPGNRAGRYNGIHPLMLNMLFAVLPELRMVLSDNNIIYLVELACNVLKSENARSFLRDMRKSPAFKKFSSLLKKRLRF